MNSILNREKTFKSYQYIKKDLAEAGFYAVGVADYVKCFSCGGGLFNWEQNDVPWIEHAKWFPECPFVLETKGSQFVNDCSLLLKNESKEMSAVNELLKTEIVLQIIDLDAFPLDIIKSVLLIRWRDENTNFTSFAHLYDAVTDFCKETLQLEDTPILENIIESESNWEGANNQLCCKICLVQDIEVVFLPCGHQLSCIRCAKQFNTCPVCRRVITSTLRTYFS